MGDTKNEAYNNYYACIPWQEHEWGELVVTSGMASAFFEVQHNHENHGKIRGLIEVRNIIGGAHIGICMAGPCIQGQITPDQLCAWLKEVQILAQEHRCVAIQFEPLYGVSGFPSDASFRAWKDFYPRATALISLNQTEEEIFAKMHQKGRYNIRQAQKKGVEVVCSQDFEEDLHIFYELFQQTTQRNNFGGHDYGYFIHMQKMFPGLWQLFIARDAEGTPIAAAICLHFQSTTLYMYGASSSDPEHRNKHAGALLQWSMIQEALRQKKAYYDFFGIAPDASDVHHPLHGVTQFKRLFTDEILCFPKAYGIVLQPGVYRILRAVRYFRNIGLWIQGIFS